MKEVYGIGNDRDIVESVTMILGTGGYEVPSQMDVKNAVANIAASGPDIIILDVMLPGTTRPAF